MTSCHGKNEHYYLTHAKELQVAIKSCPGKPPQGITCDQAEHLASRLNALGYQLQSGPQEFGKKILALQETIATQKAELASKKENAELKTALQNNQKELVDLLAVVKWLESPES